MQGDGNSMSLPIICTKLMFDGVKQQCNMHFESIFWRKKHLQLCCPQPQYYQHLWIKLDIDKVLANTFQCKREECVERHGVQLNSEFLSSVATYWCINDARTITVKSLADGGLVGEGDYVDVENRDPTLNLYSFLFFSITAMVSLDR